MGHVERKEGAIKEICDMLMLSHSQVPTDWVMGLLFFCEVLNKDCLSTIQQILKEGQVFRYDGLGWKHAQEVIEKARV
jgi:hypothetical protein